MGGLSLTGGWDIAMIVLREQDPINMSPTSLFAARYVLFGPQLSFLLVVEPF